MAKTILIASGKGGTGRTFFATNLGATLANRGKKVVLIDLDINLKNLDIYLGLESKAIFNVKDVLSGDCKIRQALVRDKRFEHLYLLAGAYYYDERKIEKEALKNLYETLKGQFDYIIVDSCSGNSPFVEVLATSIDMCIITAEPNIPNVRDTEILATHLKELNIKDIYCILNKVNIELINKKMAPSLLEITQKISINILGIIQYDENVLVSTNFGEPICLKKDTYITANFDKIVDRIVDRITNN